MLLRELRQVASEWEDIGIELRIEGQIKQLKSDNAGDIKGRLREMLRVWLSHVAPSPFLVSNGRCSRYTRTPGYCNSSDL